MSTEFENKIRAVFLDLHEDIENWSKDLVMPREHFTINFPPNSELSLEERQALSSLNLSANAKSGLKKLFVEHCSILVSHFLSNLDGEGVPSKLKADEWIGVNLIDAIDSNIEVDRELSLSDIFYDAYSEFQETKE